VPKAPDRSPVGGDAADADVRGSTSGLSFGSRSRVGSIGSHFAIGLLALKSPNPELPVSSASTAP
jgi:hypothetical protein